jgi:hypothetical protein
MPPGRGVAHHVGGADDLVVVFRVHEVEAFTVRVEEGEVAVVHEGALDLLGRPPAFRDLHPVGDAAHVELGHRGALARMDVVGGEHDVELAFQVDDRALAQRACGYFQVSFLR